MPGSYKTTLSPSAPLEASAMPQAYLLVALALFVTLIGVYAGATFALPIIASGWITALFIAEIAIIFTAPAWSRSSPLNMILFLAFPFLSGLTVTPFLLAVAGAYVNGTVILMNAAIATTLLTLASAVFARTTSMDIGATMGRFLIQALIGLVVFGLVQLFVPALRGSTVETLISGAGIVVFSLFLAWDMQRIAQSSRTGASPFLMAISLYLDIFNLFLYVVRFMTAISGNRR